MDDEEILQLVADGEIEPEDVEDFQNLEPELQEMVVSGEIDFDEVRDL